MKLEEGDNANKNERKLVKSRRPFDAASKRFFGRSDVAADMLSQLVFKGRYAVKPENLTLVDPSHYRIIQKKAGKLASDNRFGDLLFKLHMPEFGICVGVAVELQSSEVPNMPSRLMGYEARYAEDERLRHIGMSSWRPCPVISLVLNLDMREWRSPNVLYGNVGELPPFCRELVNNYRITVLDIASMAENADKMTCREYKAVLNCIRFREDEEKLWNEFRNGMPDGLYSWDAAVLLNLLLGIGLKLGKRREKINMCTAVENMIENRIASSNAKALEKGRKEGELKGRKEGELKGRKEGELKGRKEGRKNMLLEVIFNMLNLGRPASEIIAATGATLRTVRAVAKSHSLPLL